MCISLSRLLEKSILHLYFLIVSQTLQPSWQGDTGVDMARVSRGRVTRTRHVTCLTSPFFSYTNNCTYMSRFTFGFVYFQVTKTRHVTCLTSPFSCYGDTDNCDIYAQLLYTYVTFYFWLLIFSITRTQDVVCLTSPFSCCADTDNCTYISHFTFGFLCQFFPFVRVMSHAWWQNSLV